MNINVVIVCMLCYCKDMHVVIITLCIFEVCRDIVSLTQKEFEYCMCTLSDNLLCSLNYCGSERSAITSLCHRLL